MNGFRYVWPVAALCLMAACQTAQVSAPDAPSVPERFDTQLTAPYPDGQIAQWWTGYNDPELDSLIASARENNLDIAIALQRIEEIRALRDAAQADLLPSFDGFISAQLDSVLDGGAEGNVGVIAGGDAFFDPDISGRNKSRVEEVLARLEAADLNREDIERLIIQSVVVQYIELRRAEARLSLLSSSMDLQERTLEIVQARYDVGLAPALDVDRAASDLAGTRSDLGLLRAARKQALFNLSTLIGQAPTTGLLEADTAPENTEIIPDYGSGLGLSWPADMLRHRPDVRAAEATFAAELAAVSAERADLLPSLTLPGTISTSLDTDGARGINLGLGAILDIPIFDAGRRQAEVEAQMARAEAARLAWESTILTALSEVEQSLVLINAYTDQIADLEQAIEASESAYDQLDALYREGLAGFIDVLDAQRNLISRRQRLIEAEAQLATSIASLHTALGSSTDPNDS